MNGALFLDEFTTVRWRTPIVIRLSMALMTVQKMHGASERHMEAF